MNNDGFYGFRLIVLGLYYDLEQGFLNVYIKDNFNDINRGESFFINSFFFSFYG